MASGPANNENSRQQLIEIDPEGDLILVVGSTKTRFLVCSKTLSRSALFWKRCLYGPFREAKPAAGQDWVVEFPEDNPSAMKYVLLLAHAFGDKLPQITVRLAFEVTVLTNKYDMTRLLWAVAGSWLRDLKPKLTALTWSFEDAIVSQLQWLWVTKEIGAIDEYSRSFAALSQTVSTAAYDDGTLSLRRDWNTIDRRILTKQSLKGYRMYDAEKDVILLIADDIKKARSSVLEKIQGLMKKDIFILKSAIRVFDSSKGCDGANICKGRASNGSPLIPKKQRLCEYAMLAIVNKISAGKESALKPAATIGVSAESYLASAVRFISRIEREIDFVCGDKHEMCTPFKHKLPSKKDLMEGTLLSCWNQNYDAFEKQARISGLEKDRENDGVQGASGRKRSRREFEAASPTIDLSQDV